MAFVRTIISAMTLAVASVACASTISTGDARAPTDGCVLPITAYCKDRPCPTYQKALDETRAALASGNVRSMSAGRCGAYLYITAQAGMGASTDYYDRDGSLVGTVGMADSDMHCGGFTMTDGVAPQCKRAGTPSAIKRSPMNAQYATRGTNVQSRGIAD